MVTRLLALFCDLISDFGVFCDPWPGQSPSQAARRGSPSGSHSLQDRACFVYCQRRRHKVLTRTHTHTHINTCTYTETRMPKNTHADTYTHVNTHTLMLTHIITQAHIHSNIHKHTFTHTHTHSDHVRLTAHTLTYIRSSPNIKVGLP